MTGRTVMQGSPASNGFRMPAEWELHAATWIAWPHNRGDWPGKIAPVQWVYGEIARKVTLGENLRILVNTSASEEQARRILTRVGVDPGKVEFFRIPTNRGWTRDTGPIHLRREQRGRRELAIAGFKFNAWAKYPDWDLDCRVPARIAAATRRTFFPVLFNKKPVVLEGGSIRRQWPWEPDHDGGMPAGREYPGAQSGPRQGGPWPHPGRESRRPERAVARKRHRR